MKYLKRWPLELSEAATLDMLERRFNDGDPSATIHALRKCLSLRTPLPKWLCKALIQQTDKIMNYESRSWDEVFGRPVPKGAHLSALREQKKLSPLVWTEVSQRKERSETDEVAIEAVAEKFNIGLTRTKRYWKHQKSIREHLSKVLGEK